MFSPPQTPLALQHHTAPPLAPSPLQGQSTGPGVDCCWPAEPVKENTTLILVLELILLLQEHFLHFVNSDFTPVFCGLDLT